MAVKISGEEAYQTYNRLNLRKPGRQKVATLDNISTILMNFRVEVNPKPIDPVSYKFLLDFRTLLALFF